MKKVSIFIILLVISAVGVAHAGQEDRVRAAEELLNTMQVDKLLQATIEKMLEVQMQQQPAMRPYKNVMLKFLNKHMSYASLKDDLIKIYTDAFTAKELYEIAAFYKTPTGQKTLQKLPELSSKSSQLGIMRVKNNMHELKAMIQKESERLNKQKQ